MLVVATTLFLYAVLHMPFIPPLVACTLFPGLISLLSHKQHINLGLLLHVTPLGFCIGKAMILVDQTIPTPTILGIGMGTN